MWRKTSKLTRLRSALAQSDEDVLELLLDEVRRLRRDFESRFPISILNIHEPTRVIANTPILSTPLLPLRTPTTFRVYCFLDTKGTLSTLRYFGTETPNVGKLNAVPGALNASGEYAFDLVMDDQEKLNFQFDTGANLLKLSVQEFDIPPS